MLNLAHRHDRRVKGGDVRRLGHGIAEESGREAFIGKAAHLDFRLHGGVPAQPGGGHQVQVVEGQRMQGRQGALHADGGLFRIQADAQVIQHHVDNILPDLAGIVGIIRQRLVVRNQDIDFVELTGILQFHAALQGADIMTQVQPSGGAVPGQDNVLPFHSSKKDIYPVRI